jgi:spore coat protein H
MNFDDHEIQDTPIDTVNTFYLTILEMNALSFTDYVAQRTDDRKKSYDVYFLDQSANPLETGAFLSEHNAEISVKGNNPFNDIQKSFKIRLIDRLAWNNQKVINLEKQEADPLKIRNKLAMDLLESIEDQFSLKTYFTRLYIRDTFTSDVYIDYGLFVQVENVDDQYFLNRNISPNGYLYEVNDFRFENEKLGQLEDNDDIETKGDGSNKKFNSMISDINNTELTSTEVLEKYFEKEHLIKWLAFNILIGNKNIVERDYYLYSPQVSDKWYFIPDDFDGSFGRINTPDWKLGIGNYYNNALFRRVLLDDAYRQALIEAVNEMASDLNRDTIYGYLEVYYDEFFNNITNEPDFSLLEYSFDEFREKYFQLSEYTKEMSLSFEESLKYPMPFRIDKEVTENAVLLSNFASQMLDGSPVAYQIVLSRDSKQKEIIATYSTDNDYYLIENLEIGVYYVNVTATYDNFSQSMTNAYENEFGKRTEGIMRIEIK